MGRGAARRWAMPLLALAALGGLGCARAPRGAPVAAVATAPRPPEVRFRPAAPPAGDDARLVGAVPKAQWDAGLDRAAEELVARMAGRDARLEPRMTSRVLSMVGYPAQVRTFTLINGGAFPEALVDELINVGEGDPIDIGLGQRCWADGLCLWLVAAGMARASADPMPRDLPIDGTLSVRVDTDRLGELRLFVASPDGPVEELAMSAGVSRHVDRFHGPGEYRLEVVADHRGLAQVLLLFSVFVDTPVPDPGRLAVRELPPPDPVRAEAALYAALNAVREAHGLRPVERFPLFEAPAREHAALMAAAGLVRHRLPGRPGGVPEAATHLALPRAKFYEDVAAAYTADEAAALVEGSPGHLRNLLCEACTHASIGVALEPVLDRTPRLFVTWELLEFPEGQPLRIIRER